MRQELGILKGHNDERGVGLAEHGFGDGNSVSADGLNQGETHIDLAPKDGTDPNWGIIVKPWNKDMYREERAGTVALVIACTFAGFLFLGAALGGAILLIRTPGEAAPLINALTPFLESLGKSAALVFGPSLAFILGYYFRGRQQ